MVHELIYSIVSVIAISLASVIGALPFLLHKKVSSRMQVFFLSLSVGALLGVVFLDFIPEIAEGGYTKTTALFIIGGVLAFFLVEKLVHHHHKEKHDEKFSGHSHSYHLAPMNLIGDAIHNFLDGIVIATAYLVSPAIGLSATASVFFHEIPQELADFGILLYSGMSKRKALIFNFLSALTAVIGAVAAFALSSRIESFHSFMIPFACGNFIYIAATNLLPQLHRSCDLKDTAEHFLAIILGVALILLVGFLAPH